MHRAAADHGCHGGCTSLRQEPATDVPAGQKGVARGGVEPPTFRFSVGRSYQLSYLAMTQGWNPCDPDGTRTRDLRRDRAAR
jgi:hypothetical protein